MKDVLTSRNRVTNNFGFIVLAAIGALVLTSLIFLGLLNAKHTVAAQTASPAVNTTANTLSQLQAQFLAVDTSYDAYMAAPTKSTRAAKLAQKHAAAAYAKNIKTLHASLKSLGKTATSPAERKIFKRIQRDIAIYEKHAKTNIAHVRHPLKHRAKKSKPFDSSIDTSAIGNDFEAYETVVSQAVKFTPPAVVPPTVAAINKLPFILIGVLAVAAIAIFALLRKKRQAKPAPVQESEAPSPLLNFMKDIPAPTPAKIEERPFTPSNDDDEFQVQIVEQLGVKTKQLAAQLSALNETAEATIALAQTMSNRNSTAPPDPEFAAMIAQSHALAAEMLTMVKGLRRSANNIQQQVMHMLSTRSVALPPLSDADAPTYHNQP